MSVKSAFLKKLQTRQSPPAIVTSKSQADIATFRLQMEQLQEQMTGWLVETGLQAEAFTVSVPDLLVAGGAFTISAIVLRYENRTIKWIPIFLYGQGITGCVEITLHAGERVTPLGRLFMHAGRLRVRMINQQSDASLHGHVFDEDIFFHLIAGLLP